MNNFHQNTQKKFINPSENKHYLGYNPGKPCLTDRGAPYTNSKGNTSLTYNSVTPSRERAAIQEQNKFGLNNFLSPRSDNYQNMFGNQTYTNGTNLSANNGYFINQNVKSTGYRTVFQEDIPQPANQTYNYSSNNPITHQNFNMYSRSTTNITPNKSSENINVNSDLIKNHHIDRSLESSLERTRVVNDKQGDDIKKKKNGNNINATNQEILNKLKQLSNNPNGNYTQTAAGQNLLYNNGNAQSSTQTQNQFKPSSLAATTQKSNVNQILNSNNNLQQTAIYPKQNNLKADFQQKQYLISSEQNLSGSNINQIMNAQTGNISNNQMNSTNKRSITPNSGVSNNNGYNNAQIQDLLNRTQLTNNPTTVNTKNQQVSPIQQQMNNIIQKVTASNTTSVPQLGQQRQSVPTIQAQYQGVQQQQQQKQSNQLQNQQAMNINLDRRYTPSCLPQDTFNQLTEQLNLKNPSLAEQLNMKSSQQNFILPYQSPNQKQQQQQQQQTVQKRSGMNNNQQTKSSNNSNNNSNTTNQNFFKMFNNNQQRISSPNINNPNNSNPNNLQSNMMMIRNSQLGQDEFEDQPTRLITGDESLNTIMNNLDQSGQYINLESNNGFINPSKNVQSANQLPHSKNASSNQITNLTDNTNNNINNHAYTNSSSMNSYNESQNELSQENLNQYLVNTGGVNSQNNLSRDNQSNKQVGSGLLNGQNNNINKQDQEKYLMKLLQERLGDKFNQYLLNSNISNQQQQVQQKQYHSQMSPNQLLMQQHQQLQQQLDLVSLQENETPRKINKSVPIASTTNQNQHLKVSDIMKEQNKKNVITPTNRVGGLQKQIMDQIIQSKLGQSNNNEVHGRSTTPNQLLKQQQQQANMLFESSNQIENEIQQIWLQQQQQQQNQLPDQISTYQIHAPMMNVYQQQQQQQQLNAINPMVEYQEIDDFENNEVNRNNISQNKLMNYHQQEVNQQQQNDQVFQQSDLNLNQQQQQLPQSFGPSTYNQNNPTNPNNQEPIDFDEYQNYIQTPSMMFGQQQQFQTVDNEEQQIQQGEVNQQQQQQQLQQQLQQKNTFPLASALLQGQQQQQQLYQLQQQQQKLNLEYLQQQQQFLNNQTDVTKQAQQKILAQQQIFVQQLKSQSNVLNAGSSALQTNANQLLQMATQQKLQLQQQIHQQNILLQQSNIQPLNQLKQIIGQNNQQSNQQITTPITNNEIVLGQEQAQCNNESVSSSSSSQNSQTNNANANKQAQQQQNPQAISNVTQPQPPQPDILKVDLAKMEQILKTSILVEECIFELLQNREFDHQAKYLIKYEQIIQEISSLQNLPINKQQMKEIQRSINMQIVLIQIIIYEHIVVIKQLRESVRGAVSMNENLQNILNSFQYVHSSFILILILFEQAIQNLKDQGDKSVASFDLSNISNIIKERTKKRKMGFLIKNSDKISILKKFNDILQPLIQIVIEGQIELQEENRGFNTLYEDLYQIQENIPSLQISQIIDFSSKLSSDNVQFMKDEISRLSLIQERKSIQRQIENEFQQQEYEANNTTSNKSQTNGKSTLNNNQSNQNKQNKSDEAQSQQKQDSSAQAKSSQNQKQSDQSDKQADKAQSSDKNKDIAQSSKNKQEQEDYDEEIDDISYKNPNSSDSSNKQSDYEENSSSSYPESSIIGTVVSPYLKDPPKKPYTLVLDLDETLVHYQELDDGGQFLVRPYAETFLEEMSEYYEIIIFTAALQDYADFILDIIDVKKSISYKLYRQHTVTYQNSYIKDLSKIGRDMNKTIIIDNLPENFKLQPENGIYIQSWYGESEDRALYELTPLLKQIVKKKFRTVQSALKQFRDKIEDNLKRGLSEPHLNLSLEVFSGDEDDEN